jgi:GNAT superfamily N-acetyltransferase
VIVRQATEIDIPQILKNGRAFVESIKYDGIEYDEAEMLKAAQQMMADGMLVIAEEDGYHLGGVGAVKTPVFMSNAVIAMERFWWVVPDQRAAGVGKAVLFAFEKAAREAGCSHVAMIALEDENLPKVDGLYRKAGYAPFEHSYMKRL